MIGNVRMKINHSGQYQTVTKGENAGLETGYGPNSNPGQQGRASADEGIGHGSQNMQSPVSCETVGDSQVSEGDGPFLSSSAWSKRVESRSNVEILRWL